MNKYPNLKLKDQLSPNQHHNKLDLLLSYCDKNRFLFCDKEFPPELESLVGLPISPDYQGQFKRIAWKRAKEIFGEGNFKIFHNIDPNDILQGALGNCYFLCSLSALAERPELILRLFEYKEINEFGIFGVWLNINGGWRLFSLDEYLPVVENSSPITLSFSHTADNELWVLLLEKAYAKAYGCYFDIIGGDPVHALRDLTGAPYERIEDMSDLAAVWKKATEFNNKGYIFACWTKSTEQSEEQSEEGLVSGHAYSILDFRDVVGSDGRSARILKIRNPWGKFEWKGDFSDSSPLWTNRLRNELNVEVKDDGIFWMKIEDFAKDFAGIGILKIDPSFYSDSVFLDQSRNSTTFKSIIKLKAPNGARGSISVDQVDSRIIDSPEYAYSYFRITLTRLESDTAIKALSSVTSPDRNIFLDISLEPGEYIILVESYWSGNFTRSYCVGSYTKERVSLEVLNSNASTFDTLEYLAWKGFLAANKSVLQLTGKRTIGTTQSPIVLEHYKYKPENGLFAIFCTFNSSNASAVQETYNFVSLKGYDVMGNGASKQGASLVVNPQAWDYFMLKMNPKFSSFSVSHQVTDERILPNPIPDNTSILQLIKSVSGHHENIGVIKDYFSKLTIDI